MSIFTSNLFTDELWVDLSTVWRNPFDGVVVGGGWITPTDILAAEAATLKSLYDNSGGNTWTTNTGWGTGDATDYYGITVSGGSVTAIDLSGNNVSDVDAALVAIETAGTYSVTLDLSGNTAPDYGTEGAPSASATAVTELLTRDWILTLTGTVPAWIVDQVELGVAAGSLHIATADGEAMFFQSEDVYQSDFSTDLDSWVITLDGDETSTLTFDTDHIVLAVTATGTRTDRPLISVVFGAVTTEDYYTAEIRYTVNSGTCVLRRFNLAGIGVTVNETLSGTGTFSFTVIGDEDGFYPDVLFMTFNSSNLFNLSIQSVKITQYKDFSAYAAEAGVSTTLLEFVDSAGKTAQAYAGAVGGGETLGAEISTGTVTTGTLYKITATEANTFGTGLVIGDYFTADGTETCDANNKVKALTDSPVTGLEVVSAQDGAIQNMRAVDVGFDPNAITKIKFLDPNA